jgi:hypothetical protein
MWPVDELMIGDQLFTKSELLDIFDTPPRGEKRIKLIHHLIAAKLNVLRGAACEGIDAAIADADDFLTMYPLGSDLDKGSSRMIDGLKDPLVAFNESAPCGESGYDDEPGMMGVTLEDDGEEKSWGGIKNIYKK